MVRTILIWGVIFLFLFNWALWGGVAAAFIIASLSVGAMLAITYLTTWLLIPKLLTNKKPSKLFYGVLSVVMIILFTFLCVRAEVWTIQLLKVPMLHELKLVFPVTKYLILFVATFSVCNISYFSKRMAKDVEQQEKLQTEKKNLELRVLKTQINSHFLFNALNNLYSMIYFKDEETAGYLLKLSQMMRYIIEDCEAEFTIIGKEVEYIENFIEFQQLRYESAKEVRFIKQISDPNIPIAPMIMQPIVENCFKHSSLDMDINGYVHITLQSDKNHLVLTTVNSCSPIKSQTTEKDSQIGLNNVIRRINLIYKNKYTFETQKKENAFVVTLEIELGNGSEREQTENRHRG